MPGAQRLRWQSARAHGSTGRVQSFFKVKQQQKRHKKPHQQQQQQHTSVDAPSTISHKRSFTSDRGSGTRRRTARQRTALGGWLGVYRRTGGDAWIYVSRRASDWGKLFWGRGRNPTPLRTPAAVNNSENPVGRDASLNLDDFRVRRWKLKQN